MPARVPPVLERLEGIRCRYNQNSHLSQPFSAACPSSWSAKREKQRWEGLAAFKSLDPSVPGWMMPLFLEFSETMQPSFPLGQGKCLSHSNGNSPELRALVLVTRKEPAPYSRRESAGFRVRSRPSSRRQGLRKGRKHVCEATAEGKGPELLSQTPDTAGCYCAADTALGSV